MSKLIHRLNSTLKQCWFWVDSKNNLYINVEKVAVFQRRNNVSLSTLNRRQTLTLKQRWFWVYSKKQFYSYIMMLEKLKNLYANVETLTVFQCRNSVSLSTLNQRQNLTLKQRSFWVDSKKQFYSYIMLFEKSKILLYSRWKDNRISISKQRQFINVKSTSKLNIETMLILGWL